MFFPLFKNQKIKILVKNKKESPRSQKYLSFIFFYKV